MNKGLFITFEGTDGSGKTTQIKLMDEYLTNKGFSVQLVREPGGVVISEKIRSLILDNQHTEMDPVAEMLLYASARSQLVAQILKPALESGKVIICDRYVDSSYVYQGIARGIGFDAVKAVNDIATGGLMPDITFFMDIDPKTAIGRRMNASKPDRLENEAMAFHEKVYMGYRQLLEQFPTRMIQVDATGDISSIWDKIKSSVNQFIEQRLPII